MKKIFIILLMLSCFAGAFAETGYNGNQWWSKRQLVKNNLLYLITPIIPKDDSAECYEYIEIESKNMLGVKTSVYYHFFDETLSAVSYSLPTEKTKEIKSKFKNKVQELEIELKTEDNTDIEQNCELENYVFNAMITGDIEYFKNFKGKGARLSIYDYNDDTRVYIFENTTEGKTFVVYTYHEQDF